MSMSASSKNFISLSAYDRSRLGAEHTTRAQTAEQVLDATNHISTSNPKSTNISNQHKLIPEDES